MPNLLKGSMEIVVLLLLLLAPWAFGAVEPALEFSVYLGVAILLGLWGARILVEKQFAWKKCPITVILAALFLFGLVQVLPLPSACLRTLSPSTYSWYQQLLPSSEETLPFPEQRTPSGLRAGSTLSLYPAITLRESFQILAASLLFVVVRQNTASAESLRRLSLAMMVNGGLLSVFAITQYFSHAYKSVYWLLSPGQAFGPFINRNSYPFYANQCLGLALGLLIYTLFPGRRVISLGAPAISRRQLEGAAWTTSALIFICPSIFFCQSKGGFIAMLSGFLVCVLVAFVYLPRGSYYKALITVGGAVLGILIWLGFSWRASRFAALTTEGAFGHHLSIRTDIWVRGLLLAREFPIFGTGYGTFPYMEQTKRVWIDDPNLVGSTAHNEYLKALVEGGLIRLSLSLIAIGVLLHYTFRALRRYRTQRVSGLLIGTLFALIAVLVHGFVDFAIALVPAVTLLFVVICAHITELGSAAVQESHEKRALTTVAMESKTHVFRLGRLGAICAALIVFLLAWIVMSEGRRLYAYQQNLVAAFGLATPEKSIGPDVRLEWLEAAARLDPKNARVQLEIGDTHADLCRQALHQQRRTSLLMDSGRAVLWAGTVGVHPCWPAIAGFSLAAGSTGCTSNRSELCEGIRRRHLVPALRHYLRARDLCPVMAKPHARVAVYWELLEKADPRQNYLDRLTFLVPSDPALWYYLGHQEQLDGNQERARADWERGLELFRGLDPSAKPEHWYLKSQICRALGQNIEAIQALQSALTKHHWRSNWRWELAQLLFQQARYREAEEEVLRVLSQEAKNQAAQRLLGEIAVKRAKEPASPPPKARE